MTRRGTDPVDRLMLWFVAILLAFLLVRIPQVPEWPWLLAADALVVVLALLVRRLPATGGVAEFLGGAWPLIIISAFYSQLGVMHSAVGVLHDGLVQRWELTVFGAQVSATWHRRMPYPPLSAVLHACYGAYYFIVALVPLWFWFKGERASFRRAVFINTLALLVCYVIFAAFPVAGPHYTFPLVTGRVVENLPARYVYFMLGAASIGTAFPSSHVVAAWCSVYAAWRDARRLALVLAPVAFLLAVGTVYGQFHYAVDAVAGAILSLLLMAVADPLSRLLARPLPR